MKSTRYRKLSVLGAILGLIVLTACSKSSSKEETSEIGSSSQIEEAQPAEETSAEQGQPTADTEAEQGQPAEKTAAEQGQSNDETAAEQDQSTDETAAEQGQPTADTEAEQGQPAKETAAEQGQSNDETAAEQDQSTDETAAEQGQPDEDVMQLLQQADEAAQEKYDNLDLSDKASVIEMVQALTQMDSAIHRAKYQPIATWDADGKILSIDQEIRCVNVEGAVGPTLISYMKGREGLVIARYGGDDYTLYYVCDGILIGKESGHSTGRLDFSGCLPDWKDDPAGETHSIIDGREITDEYNGRDYDEDVEHVGEILKEAEAVLREAGE